MDFFMDKIMDIHDFVPTLMAHKNPIVHDFPRIKSWTFLWTKFFPMEIMDDRILTSYLRRDKLMDIHDFVP